jgi:hypothetical protein
MVSKEKNISYRRSRAFDFSDVDSLGEITE